MEIKEGQDQFKNVRKIAERYHDKYRDQMDLLEGSILSKVKGGIGSYDVYALGKQLESWDSYVEMCEEQGNTNLLGSIPNIAYDVITAVHGASILPIVSSVQPIDEERGTVYFKQVRSSTTKGSQTAGNVVVDPRTGVVTPTGYSNNIFEDFVAATSVSATLSYSFTLAGPVKSESLSVKLGTTAIVGKDVGNGAIWGNGVSGTINYISGAVTLVFAANPGAGVSIFVTYQQNYELSTDIPKIDTFFASQGILARLYALKGTIGMMQAYGMSKRFGMVAEEELAKDLVSEINREIGGDIIRKLRASAISTATFTAAPPSGVSYFEHKQAYKDTLAQAEANLVNNSGRGAISVLIVGKSQAAIIQTLPGFQKLADGNTLGAHVFGTLDGITVVRTTETSMLGDAQGIAIYKGQTPWEAAAVYSPFMPLTVTATLPQAPNPLQSMKAAAVWAGVDVLVPQFATKVDVV